jgi:hypothetical protein
MSYPLAPHCKNKIKLNPSSKPVFIDEQPSDRQNLVYYSDYLNRNGNLEADDAVIRAIDEAYIQIYHNELPKMLKSSPWSREPSSRCCFKADEIKKISSLVDVANNIYNFTSDILREKKKIGTILLCGHGTPSQFAIPIGPSRRLLSLPMLEMGLDHADSINAERQPRGWQWGQDLWDHVREDLRKLSVIHAMLRNALIKRTDEKTLIRIWCCNLGRRPQDISKDPLKIIGNLLLGNHKGNIEAPKCVSAASYFFYTTRKTSHQKVLNDIFGNAKLHPDILAEVQSDSQRTCFQEKNLKKNSAHFISSALRPPPTPEGRKGRHWLPFWALEKNNRVIHQNNQPTFSRLWRRVKLD